VHYFKKDIAAQMNLLTKMTNETEDNIALHREREREK
jgi:hypothetical protein